MLGVKGIRLAVCFRTLSTGCYAQAAPLPLPWAFKGLKGNGALGICFASLLGLLRILRYPSWYSFGVALHQQEVEAEVVRCNRNVLEIARVTSYSSRKGKPSSFRCLCTPFWASRHGGKSTLHSAHCITLRFRPKRTCKRPFPHGGCRGWTRVVFYSSNLLTPKGERVYASFCITKILYFEGIRMKCAEWVVQGTTVIYSSKEWWCPRFFGQCKACQLIERSAVELHPFAPSLDSALLGLGVEDLL